MAETLAVQMEKILNEYSEEVQDVTNAAIKKVARESVRRLKNTLPKKSGDYARSWSLRNLGLHDRIADIVVHNTKHYQLTHLLERGHVVRNKYGTYGRASAHPHIKPVEEWANNELPAEIERKLR